MIDISDSDFNQAIDGLDFMYQGMESFKSIPGEDVQERVQEFIDFMSFHPGSLHKCLVKFPWLFGDLENPEWLGQAPNQRIGELTIFTEPEEPFLVVGCPLLKSSFARPNRDDEYQYVLKVMVRDKIAYTPLPIDQMDENGANHFKTLFSQVVTER